MHPIPCRKRTEVSHCTYQRDATRLVGGRGCRCALVVYMYGACSRHYRLPIPPAVIGKVNPRHLQAGQSWDVRVGCLTVWFLWYHTNSIAEYLFMRMPVDPPLSLATTALSLSQYLGCVPGVRDWKSPSSRSEFMEMVDHGQVRSQPTIELISI